MNLNRLILEALSLNEFEHLYEKNIVLNIVKNTLTIYDMNYYDTQEPVNGVKGYISLSSDENNSYVSSIAGEKGFGRIMYLLAMQHSYPKPIMIGRDGDIRDSAFDSIEKLKNSDKYDIEIKEIQSESDEYVDCLDFGCDEQMPEFFEIYNTKFYCKPSFINNIEKTNDVKINRWGSDYFDYMYSL